jgi:hypothetical protein
MCFESIKSSRIFEDFEEKWVKKFKNCLKCKKLKKGKIAKNGIIKKFLN